MTVVGVQINGWNFAEETAAPRPSAGSATLVANTQAASADLSSREGPLGTSAKIGIGVGVSLAVTGLAALGVGLLMMYRARKAARSMIPSSSPSMAEDLSNAAGGPMLSSKFSRSHIPTPELQQTNNGLETAHYYQEQSSSAYPSEHHIYRPYGITVPHGEMEGTTVLDVNERSQRRMELEGEFDRNVKVLHHPPR